MPQARFRKPVVCFTVNDCSLGVYRSLPKHDILGAAMGDCRGLTRSSVEAAGRPSGDTLNALWLRRVHAVSE